MRWINTRELEVHVPALGPEGWRRIGVKEEVKRAASQVLECLASKADFPERREEASQRLIRQHLSQVFATYFRAKPVAETLRIATREALRRSPRLEGLKGTQAISR